MSQLYAFSPADGRYQATIVVDRPLEDYASRLEVDLTNVSPPAAVQGFWRRYQQGSWSQVEDGSTAPTLSEAQLQKWIAMKVKRRAAVEAPLDTPYGVFDADEKARDNIAQTAQFIQTQAQALMPGSEPSVDFTLADNSVVTLTAQQMVEVALMLGDQVQAAYARGRDVRAAIYAATTIEEVTAIEWETP